MGNIQIISKKGIKQNFQLSSIVGKQVIAENGEVVGKVKDIAFSANKVVGVYMGRALGSSVLIDQDHIREFNADSVILKINPVTALIGKLVFDKDGKKLGKITQLVRTDHKNDFTDILVKKNPVSGAIKIPKKNLSVISKNVILDLIM